MFAIPAFSAKTIGFALGLIAIPAVYINLSMAAEDEGDEAIEDVLQIYVSPDGDDTNDGRTPESAVPSLQRAHDIINDLPPDFRGDIDVLVAGSQGVYNHETAIWHRTIPEHLITIRPADNHRPRFEGVGNGVFFDLTPDEDGGHVRLEGLDIVGYTNGVGLNYANENQLVDLNFIDVGGILGGGHGYSAVHIVYSSRNVIDRCRFVRIAPYPGGSAVHGVYIAYGSKDNEVIQSYFEDVLGTGVKIRDQSHRTNVRGNVFFRVGDGAGLPTVLLQSFVYDNEDGTPGARECPSLENQVGYNLRCGGFTGSSVDTWRIEHDPLKPGQICSDEGGVDPLHTFGNRDLLADPDPDEPWCVPLEASEVERRIQLWGPPSP